MDKKEMFIIFALSFLCLILWGSINYLSNSLYFDGLKYNSLENSIHQLRNENMKLKDELLEKTSYNYIYQSAMKQGFVPAPFVPL